MGRCPDVGDRVRIGTGILLLLTLAACGPAHPNHGTITGKHIEPAYMSYIPITVSCGKNCSTVVMTPIFHSTAYVLHVHGCDNAVKATCWDWTWDVPQGQYDAAREGDGIAAAQ